MDGRKEEKKKERERELVTIFYSYLYRNNIVRWFDRGEESIFVRCISSRRKDLKLRSLTRIASL